jgi:group I intron endonuclease
MAFHIYLIHNLINNKVYVGRSVNVANRWIKHIRVASGNVEKDKYPIHRAITKYGVENFNFSILQELSSNQECNQAEKYWISYFNAKDYDFGYNLTDGGEGAFGHVVSETARQKIREKATGRGHTQETKELLRLKNIGRKHTQEAKDKMSAKNLGKVLSAEHRQKLSEAKKGIVFTEGHRQNISKAQIGKHVGTLNHFYGKTHTEEVKEKFRGENNKTAKLTASQVIEIREKYGTGNYSQQQLANEYGVSREQIGRIVRGVDWKHLLPKESK